MPDAEVKKPTYEDIKNKGSFTEDESDIIAAKAKEERQAETVK